MIVDIALERDQENPQLIFESMNSTGKALSEADLIRNYILMGLEHDLQTDIYQSLWRPMELDFGQEAYGEQFDDFMRHYLTIKTGDIPRLSEVYEAFKEYAVKFLADGGNVKELVSDIRKYAKYFVAMALDKEQNEKLKVLFNDLFRNLNYGVAYPFLMQVYADFEDDAISEGEFVEIIKLVESYVFRRLICQIPTNSMNKTFAEFMRHVDKSDYLSSVRGHLYQLKSYRRFPNDEEFTSLITQRDVYNFYSRMYMFRKFENYGKKEFISVDNYTIEHVLPQNPNLSVEWQSELGSDWRVIQERYLHTLGNLSLTGYNSEYSDRPFSEKKSMTGGFAESPLRLNALIGKAEKWDEREIINRAQALALEAKEIWPSLNMSVKEVEKWMNKPELVRQKSTYQVQDHEYLSRPHVQELFEAIRKEILAIDPAISETFLKYWIAYKVDSNFVDLVPKAKGFRLSINMRYSEIKDPKGMTEDITGKGRWGNGDVSVHFRKLEDLPYIMGLIRQSYDKQLS
jgi:predicted transport protein